MRRLFPLLIILTMAGMLLPLQPAEAQFGASSVNGSIGANEYGDHADGQNRKSTNTSQDWFVTWDDNNLYVGITNANLFESAVIYIDKNPVSPVNGGSTAQGSLAGFNYDNTSFAALPFRADFVSYIKHDYREFRTADGAGGWTNSTAFFGNFADSFSGNVREIAIPWSNITAGGGRPASFNFFGYLTSPGGFVYGQVPNDNPGAFIGTGATYTRYFAVDSTANGASTKPFSQNRTSAGGDIQFNGLRHDTFDNYYRSPFGAVPGGSNVTLRFRTAHFDVDGVKVRIYEYDPATDTTIGPVDYPMAFFENRTENSTLYDIWTLNLATPATPRILYYKFRVTDASDVAFYSDAYADDHDNLNQGGEGAASDNEPFPAFQLTVYDPAFQTPDWLRNANVYQIFPDRFRNGDPLNDYCVPGSTSGCPTFYGDQTPLARAPWNSAIGDPRQPGEFQNQYGTQFFGGDLKGIEQKLDYLKSLNIDAIYLNPIFKARSNHRYDTDDYLEVDPALGGDAALASLVAAADARGIRLIFDGVFNHSSSDSLYFDRYHRYPHNGACEDLASPFRSWYVFNNSNTPCGGADYPAWFGFDSLPIFEENAAVRDFFYRGAPDNVTKHWLERGASGWRFDVATDLSHNWWREYRQFAKSYSADAALIGENFPDASQYLAGDQLDSVMNYRFRKNVLGFARGAFDWSDNDNSGSNRIQALSPSQFDHALRSVREDYPAQATQAMLNLLDSHDTNRALYVLSVNGDNGLNEARERLRLAALFQFAYPGAPMVYYGDEAALNAPSTANGVNGPEDDPYNRAPYPWSDEGGNAGVYGPADAPTISYYSTLARLRKLHPALRTGTFETLLTGDTTPSSDDNSSYAFARVGGGERVVAVFNNGAGANTASVPVGAHFADGTTLYDALNQPATYTVSGGAVSITLAPRTGTILLSTPPGDLTPPVMAALPNITQSADPDQCGAVVTFAPTATDASAVTITSSPASGSVFPVGTTAVNVVATDAAGNSSASGFMVTVVDDSGPVITTPPDVNVTTGASANSCGATVGDATLGTATANDNCAGTVAVTRSGVPADNFFPVGSTVITYTATDAGGRTTTTTQTVNVIDDTPPLIACPSDITVTLPPNSNASGVAVNYPAVTATDNCPGALTVATTIASGSIFPIGTTTVTATATDSAATPNTSTCSFTVTVLYNFAGFFKPIANLPAINKANAGQAISVKFSLGGDKGLNIFDSGYPASSVIPCDPSAVATTLEPTTTAGASGLSYDSASDQYGYVWKTDKAWAGTCRQLVVRLNDGSYHRANFSFK